MLYIITEKQFYPLFVLQPLVKRSDICLLPYHRSDKKGINRIMHNALRSLHAKAFGSKGFLSGIIYDRQVIKQLSKVRPGDHVLFFALRNGKDISAFNAAIKNKVQKSIFFWDSLIALRRTDAAARKFTLGLKRLGFRITTFDGDDAHRYGLETANEVYRPLPNSLLRKDVEVNSDVFFAAADKGRMEKIVWWTDIFDKQGIVCDFTILRDKSTGDIPEQLKPYYDKSFINYNEYIRKARSSKALLEILQPGQSGMTMRTLEALFLNRKLITDNANAREYDFYHPDNIYVLDGKENRTIREFLETPMHKVGDKLKRRYNIEYWIEQFK